MKAKFSEIQNLKSQIIKDLTNDAANNPTMKLTKREIDCFNAGLSLGIDQMVSFLKLHGYLEVVL